MSLAWMTDDRREEREDRPRVQPNLRSRITIARRCILAAWEWVAGFVTGLILGLALLHLTAARAQREIIIDFTTPAAITAPASAEDSDLLISCGDVPPAPGLEEMMPS